MAANLPFHCSNSMGTGLRSPSVGSAVTEKLATGHVWVNGQYRPEGGMF